MKLGPVPQRNPLPKERASSAACWERRCAARWAEWLRDLWEWPRTVSWLENLGAALAARCHDRTNGSALPLNGLALILRNALFIPLVLAHGFRRLLPPY